MSTSAPGIVELVGICQHAAERNRRLFEIVGSWVATESDPELQRWFSAAGHRHAWHAELWTQRRPAIPAEPATPTGDLDDPGVERVAWYRAQLSALSAEIASLAARVDAVLDPATARITRLVAADLAELAAAAPGGDTTVNGS